MKKKKIKGITESDLLRELSKFGKPPAGAKKLDTLIAEFGWNDVCSRTAYGRMNKLVDMGFFEKKVMGKHSYYIRKV